MADTRWRHYVKGNFRQLSLSAWPGRHVKRMPLWRPTANSIRTDHSKCEVSCKRHRLTTRLQVQAATHAPKRSAPGGETAAPSPQAAAPTPRAAAPTAGSPMAPWLAISPRSPLQIQAAALSDVPPDRISIRAASDNANTAWPCRTHAVRHSENGHEQMDSRLRALRLPGPGAEQPTQRYFI